MSTTSSVRALRAEDLNPGDHLVLAFPEGTEPHQVRALLEDGWFVADNAIMDDPAKQATHADGRPLAPQDVAARIPAKVTYAALGQTTVLLSLDLPDDNPDEYARHINRLTKVTITR